MNSIAIAVAFLGLLAFFAFREWLRRQDFEVQFKRDVQSLRDEVHAGMTRVDAAAATSASKAADSAVGDLRRDIDSVTARVGRIEAFAGFEDK
jgi:hypothetical protein